MIPVLIYKIQAIPLIKLEEWLGGKGLKVSLILKSAKDIRVPLRLYGGVAEVTGTRGTISVLVLLKDKDQSAWLNITAEKREDGMLVESLLGKALSEDVWFDAIK